MPTSLSMISRAPAVTRSMSATTAISTSPLYRGQSEISFHSSKIGESTDRADPKEGGPKSDLFFFPRLPGDSPETIASTYNCDTYNEKGSNASSRPTERRRSVYDEVRLALSKCPTDTQS